MNRLKLSLSQIVQLTQSRKVTNTDSNANV